MLANGQGTGDMSMVKLTESIWTQIDGDMDVATYGGTIARIDGDAIEVRKIQPVREYVGDCEAADIGVPFCSREGYYRADDLGVAFGKLAGDGPLERGPEVKRAMVYVGMTEADLAGKSALQQMAMLASACLDYGHLADEGPSGWARDVMGSDRCRWYGSKRPRGWRYLASEDAEFRAMTREVNR